MMTSHRGLSGELKNQLRSFRPRTKNFLPSPFKLVSAFPFYRHNYEKLLCVQATDGIFDNVPDRLLIEAMDTVQHCKDKQIIQQCANSIALMARKLSRDPKVPTGHLLIHCLQY